MLNNFPADDMLLQVLFWGPEARVLEYHWNFLIVLALQPLANHDEHGQLMVEGLCFFKLAGLVWT